MDKCPVCKRYTLSYNPQAEESYCYECGFKAKLPYGEYIALKNCIENLHYPSNQKRKDEVSK